MLHTYMHTYTNTMHIHAHTYTMHTCAHTQGGLSAALDCTYDAVSDCFILDVHTHTYIYTHTAYTLQLHTHTQHTHVHTHVHTHRLLEGCQRPWTAPTTQSVIVLYWMQIQGSLVGKAPTVHMCWWRCWDWRSSSPLQL